MRSSVVLAALLLLGPPGAAGASRSAPTPTRVVPVAVSYSSPVTGPLRVRRRFDTSAGAYGPGHRGVDLAAVPSGPVFAAADGVVTFAGAVAGRGVVVVGHADGIRTEYEPVRAAVHPGQAVRRGQTLGTLVGDHPGCGGACVHWGARRGEQYVDPLTLLRPLGPVRLLPWDG